MVHGFDARLGQQRAAPRDVHRRALVDVVRDFVEARVRDKHEVDAVAVRVEVVHLRVGAAHVERRVSARGSEFVVVVVHRHHSHHAVAALHESLMR